jgi:hypothetical protein
VCADRGGKYNKKIKWQMRGRDRRKWRLKEQKKEKKVHMRNYPLSVNGAAEKETFPYSVG